ncbi:branched-chain amino acid ABC transporter permease [Azospirillum sp. TSO22-1]|uniref:branched-chain amino acid ABC transporter permease n=1 Tax=Azospirillum sp. TSO22-1 TaxID=716789 RepID=UPI000D61EED9|nr:branched-chain amino acid ABC transporter permease [Azospirillum sp. TSO22-1]PWC52693.1 amino acid ABC transporter permease [Azospirillum sp. TSO22-1]
MTADLFLQILVSGLLIGLIYALVAVGLTLIFGVMDIVNFAHGEFLMLGMYASFWGFALFGIDPILSMPVTAALLFGVGVLVYQVIIRRIINAPMLSQIFATFGLMILFRGLAQFFWKPDHRLVTHTLVGGNVTLGSIQFGLPQLTAAVGAVGVTAGLWYFLHRTRLGTALEATAIDREAATLMGINGQSMFALAWGIGAACAGIGGALIATFFPIFPEVGSNFILIAFVVVVLGGFGSIVGAFWAGIIVGVIEVVGGFVVGPEYKTAIVLSLLLLVLLVRPKGLMGKA